MKLIIGRKKNPHVSLDTVAEFELSILADALVHHTTYPFTSKLASHAWSMLHTAGRHAVNLAKPLFGNKALGGGDRDYFAVLMGADFSKCAPYFMLPGRKNIYLFDAWPNEHERIRKFVKFWKINNVFLTSSQATEMLNASVRECNFYWTPEAIDPTLYRQYPYTKKDIDVLQFGRKYDAYHELICKPLEKNRKVYLYERKKGEIVFSTREEFVEGLARSKVSICVPSNITHPERSGDIETMTVRYLQSMISKCLIVGHAPKEMIDLFGYNPVIEVDMENPVSQLQCVLNNFSQYLPLIEKNYVAIVNNHTWHNRWREISSVLFP